MNLQDQLAKLAVVQPDEAKPEPTLESALQTAHKAKASMVAVWSVTPEGQLEYHCFRKDFPVSELRQSIEQFANDQLSEEFRCRVMDVVHPQTESSS